MSNLLKKNLFSIGLAISMCAPKIVFAANEAEYIPKTHSQNYVNEELMDHLDKIKWFSERPRLRAISKLIKDKKIILPYKPLGKNGGAFEKMKWNISTGRTLGRCGSHGENIVTDGIDNKSWGGCNYDGGDSTSTLVNGAYSVRSSTNGGSYRYSLIVGSDWKINS